MIEPWQRAQLHIIASLVCVLFSMTSLVAGIVVSVSVMAYLILHLLMTPSSQRSNLSFLALAICIVMGTITAVLYALDRYLSSVLPG